MENVGSLIQKIKDVRSFSPRFLRKNFTNYLQGINPTNMHCIVRNVNFLKMTSVKFGWKIPGFSQWKQDELQSRHHDP